MMLSSALMVAAFVIVALFSSSHHNSSTIQMNLNMTMQLIGCAFASTQCGMGEASLLALAGKCDVGRSKKACLTAFSSGTGLAGVFGYMWKFVWNDWLGLSVRITLYLATILALLYGGVYYTCLWEVNVGTAGEIDAESTAQLNEDTSGKADRPRSSQNNTDQGDQDSCPTEEFGDEEREPSVKRIEDMTARQRFQAVLRLWPYMIPLFVVYAAEYALQAGTWTAIGFPVDDEEARDQFYEYSNWMVSSRCSNAIAYDHAMLTRCAIDQVPSRRIFLPVIWYSLYCAHVYTVVDACVANYKCGVLLVGGQVPGFLQ